MGSDDLRGLRGVDESRGEFTGLIDPQSTVHEFTLFLAQNISRLRGTVRSGRRGVSVLGSDRSRGKEIEEDW